MGRFFIMRLYREGFFAWWQPQYNEDMSEIHYYRYCENDEESFIAEKEFFLRSKEKGEDFNPPVATFLPMD